MAILIAGELLPTHWVRCKATISEQLEYTSISSYFVAENHFQPIGYTDLQYRRSKRQDVAVYALRWRIETGILRPEMGDITLKFQAVISKELEADLVFGRDVAISDDLAALIGRFRCRS